MVDIVRRTVRVLEVDQNLDGLKNILVRQSAHLVVARQAEALVELVAAHQGKVVIVRIAEQVIEEGGRDFGRGRRTGPQTAIDFLLRLLHGGGLVQHQRIADG